MSENRRGNLFIVSAPSGAGKTSLCQKLMALVPNIRHSVSFTTRPLRQGEVHDRDYSFVSEETFGRMVEEGAFAEYARVHGHLYGTAKKRLDEIRDQGIDIILDIDTQGAQQMRRNYGEGVYIFILPPSMEALQERLDKRMSNSPEEIRLRMGRAVEEISEYKNYDYVIINNDFTEALTELKAIILAENRRKSRMDSEWIEQTFHL